MQFQATVCYRNSHCWLFSCSQNTGTADCVHGPSPFSLSGERGVVLEEML
jgi:hypothetical protein